MAFQVENIPAKKNLIHFSLSERVFWLTCAVITIVAAILRLVSLDVYPQLFNQDEITLGYDAWSIWITGKDQHNEFLPVYFRTFNDAVPPVANYFTSPFVGLLGLSQFSTRLPFALLGTASVFLTGVLGRRWFGNVAGLVAALLLTFEPWHLNYSRIAFPASTVPFLIVLSLYSFTRFIEYLQNFNEVKKKKPLIGWLLLSAIAFALLTGSYSPLKLEAPLLIIGCGLAALALLWKHFWISLGWFVTYLACISPLIINQLSQWNQVQIRFNQMSVFSEQNWLLHTISNYFLHFDPQKLFFSGFKGGVGVLAPGIGELFWLEAPLCLIGLFYLAFRKSFPSTALNLAILTFFWFLTFPVASSLTTMDLPHEIRTYNLLPLPELLTGYAVVIVWHWVANLQFGKLRIALLLSAIGISIFASFIVLFISNYFQPPLLQSTLSAQYIPYNIGLEPTLKKLGEITTPCDKIWMSETNETYIYYLFLTRYPPNLFQNTPKEKLATKNGFLLISNYANVNFGSPLVVKAATLPPECIGQASREFYVTSMPEDLLDWQELFRITNKNNEPVWKLLVKNKAL